jgi:hypothetical protein
MLLYSILAADQLPDPSVLPVWALGPIAGLVFILFITELIVPGRSFKRLDDDYKKSRELNEKVIPLAEKMTDSQNDLARALDRVTQAMEDVLEELARQQGSPPNPPSRRRGQWQ